MFVSTVPVESLEADERNAPQSMKWNFPYFTRLQDNLILFDKIQHGKKAAQVYPGTQHLNSYCPFFSVSYNPLREEHS